jgi:hypothetical protein
MKWSACYVLENRTSIPLALKDRRCDILKMGRNIVSLYLEQIRQSKQSHQSLLELDDASLSALLPQPSMDIPVDERLTGRC